MLHHIIENYGLIGIFITLILEVGLFMFPLPGDTLIFATGIFVETKVFNLSTAFSVIFMSSIIAGHLGYFIGKNFGIRHIKHNPIFSVDEKHIEKTKEFFKKYGPIAIIISRFIPIIRTFISPLLGAIHYNKYKFAFYNLIASLLWTTTFLWLGITIGKFFPNIVRYTEYIVLTAIFIFLIPIIYKIVFNNLRLNKK